jgi:hypothetical protein
MATKNPRLNLTLEPPLVSVLSSLAKKEHTSVANMAKELILEALDRREDLALSAIAEARELATQKKVSHEDAWK